MRISDWSSDVCSSDLNCHIVRLGFSGQSVVEAFFLANAGNGPAFVIVGGIHGGFVRQGEQFVGDRVPRLMRVATLKVGTAGAPDQQHVARENRLWRTGRQYETERFAGMADRKSTRLNSSHSCATRMPS